ncbi:MAG TPA: terminase gpA endonuclease subunit [Hyphomicrobiales bacterium]|nr:terminase gpA endonuclease subunit [Hyphomicrobiales bacterium]
MIQELEPKPIPPTAEWAEDEYRLPAESGDTHGNYRLNYVPYMHGIFAALDDPNVREVVVMKAAQIGWTFALLAWLFRAIRFTACTIVGMFPKEAAAKQFNDEKLVPAVRATPAIDDLIDTTSSRKSTNTALFKSLPNGFLKLVGSKSISSVKSTPARIVFVEEPDDATDDLAKQGNAIKLLWERTKRIPNSKRIMGGTPSVKGLSKVEDHIKRSDKRVLPIECHDCGERHVLDWANVSWQDAEDGREHEVYGKALPETAVYACPNCGSVWDDYQRRQNIRNTVQEALEVGDPLCGWTPTAQYSGIVGFMELSELYSCLPGAGLEDLVRDHLSAEYEAAHGDETERIVFDNSKLARPYEYQDDQASRDELKELALDYPEQLCPAGGLLMTVGIDVQHNRIAVIKRAWGRGEESWGLLWVEIYAKTATTDKSDQVWTDLENLTFAAVEHASGTSIYPSAVSIDSSDGQTNDAVYSWVRRMNKAHPEVLVMAIKGSSAQTDPEIFATPPRKSIDHHNPDKQTKADRWGLKPYIVGTGKAKDWLAAHMKLSGVGPGRFHQSKHVREDYWDQVTGEVKAPHRTLKNKKVWQRKSGCAVEAWDCEVYALHAARARRIHLKSAADWDALEQKLLQADLFSVAVQAPKPAAAAPAKDTSAVQQQLADLARRFGNGS